MRSRLARVRRLRERAWVVDDTGLVKKGTHSVGVTRQYCGQVGKQENCRVAVSLSITTAAASLPLAWRLYLPQVWSEDKERREATGVPAEIKFQTKPEISLEQIRAALDRGIPKAPVLGDAGYGNDTKFRDGITDLDLLYVCIRHPVIGKCVAAGPGAVAETEMERNRPTSAWKTVSWREGTRKALRSRFAAVRIRPAHRSGYSPDRHPGPARCTSENCTREAQGSSEKIARIALYRVESDLCAVSRACSTIRIGILFILFR